MKKQTKKSVAVIKPTKQETETRKEVKEIKSAIEIPDDENHAVEKDLEIIHQKGYEKGTPRF